MRKTTIDRLTSGNINNVVHLTKGTNIDIVGVLVALEENLDFNGHRAGVILHIGNKMFSIDNSEMDDTEISFPEAT